MRGQEGVGRPNSSRKRSHTSLIVGNADVVAEVVETLRG